MFIAKTGSDIFAALGVPFPSELLLVKVILPVGISFYTFQGLSYTIDIYRGIARPTRSFLDFACYIVMFPQLIAGPIVRYTHMENQLRVPCFSYARIYAGIQFFILGLAKKVLLADTASLIADGVFASTAGQLNDLSSLDALLGGLAYTLQIYFDFSGYSDMAVGLGYFCGYDFNSPYKSKSITEFWRRWHITLSTWMRDYVYIPLGGSRRGWGRTYVNLVVTFLLCGFWHGANWTFVLWGAFHGALLMSDRLTAGWSVLRRVPAVLRVAVTFVLVSIGWYIFRAPSVGVAMGLLGSLFNGDFVMREIIRIENWKVGLAAMACGMGIVFGCRNSWEISKDVSVAKTMALLLLLFLSVVFLFGNVSHPFLYFQF
jgi:alginate O-acetyltransferase complex protein AlgI